MTELAQMEQGQVTAISQLPRDLAIVRMQQDQIAALACARPRNYKAVLDRVTQQIEAFPSFASSAIYAKPVGKDPQTGTMKWARGLSVRTAEALAEAYGYNEAKVDVMRIDADNAKVEASFIDYQTGRVWRKGAVVSRMFRSRDGQTRRHSEDRFYGVICEAAGSKLVRECILRSIPPGLRSEVTAAIKGQMGALLDDEGINRIIEQFARKGVSQGHLEALLGKVIGMLTQEDRLLLGAIWTGLEQGETSIAELMGDEAVQQAASPGARGEAIAAAVKRPSPAPPPAPPNETMTKGAAPPVKPDALPKEGLAPEAATDVRSTSEERPPLATPSPPETPAEPAGADEAELETVRAEIRRLHKFCDTEARDSIRAALGLKLGFRVDQLVAALNKAPEETLRSVLNLAQEATKDEGATDG